MACCFDKPFCDKVRKSCVDQKEMVIDTRDGRIVEIPQLAECPAEITVGLSRVPVWCSNCSGVVEGSAIRFIFEFNNPLVGRVDQWIHQNACKNNWVDPTKLK